MHLRLIDYALWIFVASMQASVLVAMYRRGFHREYPYFFNYTVLQISSDLILFPLRNSPTLYYWGYWVSLALSALLSFAVIQEVFKNAFRPYAALRDLSAILFRWSALVILLVAGMWAFSSTRSGQTDIVMGSMLLVEKSVRLMQCGLVFFLLLFSEYLGISRKSMLFGVALGFGLYASVSMLIAVALSHGSLAHVALTLRWIKMGAYDMAVVLWLGYAVFAPARDPVSQTVARSKAWNDALENAHLQPGADSLLDTMDRMVERLLYPQEEEAKVPVSAGTR
jgi:hypothetical protein